MILSIQMMFNMNMADFAQEFKALHAARNFLRLCIK